MHAVYDYFYRLVPANPMVVRIVQGGSRRLRHLWVRMGYLGAIVLLVVIGLFSGSGTASLDELAAAGSSTFNLIAYGQVILTCLLAPLFMAGAIASERSGQTYNILLTTPLSNLQIVLGSLVGRLFFIMALLLSGLPLFSVLLIFGGVPVQSIFVSFLLATLVAVLIGAIAVTLSVLRAGGRKAVFTFVICIAAYLVGGYLIDRLLLRLITRGLVTPLTPLHPLLVLESFLFSAAYRPRTAASVAAYPAWFGWYLMHPLASFTIITLAISAVLLVGCSLGVRAVGTGESRWVVWLKRKLRVRTPGVAARKRPARTVGTNPIAWREANTRGKVASGILARWGFTAIGLLLGAGLVLSYHMGWLPKIPNASGGFDPDSDVFHNALLVLLLLEVAIITLTAIYMSAGSVSKEREDGTLDIMLTTPITPQYYIWGKLQGLVRFLSLLIAVPVITLLMASLYTIVGQLRGWPGATMSQMVSSDWQSGSITLQTPLVLYEAPLLLLLMLVPFVALCVGVGMSWSLKSRGVLGATVWTVGIVMLVGLVLAACGYQAARNIPLIGPTINAFSPATNIFMLVNPWQNVASFADSEAFGRFQLWVAALAAAGGYVVIVYALIMGMVRGFDTTVRKLSGGK